MVHTLRLDNYSPTPRKLVLGTNSSFGTESIKIERGAGWDGLNITATWHIPGREEPLRVALLDGDAMDVPPEVTKEAKDGVLVLAGLASGVQRASCNVEYLILEQAGVYGGADAEPTPELAAQVLEAALQAKADAKAAAEDAAAAKANADKAQADAEKAQQAAENAAADAAKAGPYAEAARAAQEAAESARDEAIAAQRAAENAAAAAAASKSAADTLAAEAARAAQAAENSKTTANNAANFAGENATAAQQAADTATAAANDAGQSASDAAASKAAAETAAKAAKDAQAAAAAAKAEAVKAQEAAQTAAKSAQDAQAAAEKARDEAKTAQKGAEAARDTAAKSAEAAAKSEANAKQSADTLAESVENVVANTAAVAELKEKKAEIDDTAVRANAWSSKHIIDMLCPPLEESGNPVVCYPVAGYPLGVKAKWEPAQEGSGTPSPENIRPISGRDAVKVERCGENLLPFGERIENIYKQQLMTSDDLLLLSKACAGQELTLTFSTETKNIVFDDDVEDEWRKRIGFECHGTLADGTEVYTLQCWFDDANDELTKNGKKTKTVTVTMPKLASGDIVFYAQNIKSGSFVAYDFGIYAGTTAPTTYTPYNGQTNILTLPETVYGGEVDAVTGEGQETWQAKSFDGTEGWLVFDAGGKDQFFYTTKYTIDKEPTKSICSHFSTVRYAGASIIRIYTNMFTDTSAFSSYLAAQNAAGTPVQIAYKLAEPVPFTATGAQALPALAGLNTVLTDADSATVTGRADPIKRIEDLEAAVASIN
jgi:hypothetical protein|nr:MAG TPA: hypothetical protein [Bacteriophage sp.]